LYAAVLAAKDGLRTAGVLRTKKLKWPVVSVGSLSAGGAGKTPVVIALAEMLRDRGWAVDVLSRGYRREGRGVERVNPAADRAARRFGDEPVLLAQRLGVPVWVGADRFAAGMAAEASVASGEEADSSAALRNDKPRCVHVLDDGFQHRGLARVLDVVLVTAEDLDDVLLPAGDLREPLAALRRADVVVVREEERERVEARVRGLMPEHAAIWTVRRTVDFPEAAKVSNRDYGLVAFCAIARPENFVESLRAEGGRVIDSVAFPDHHTYTSEDMHQLTESWHILGGDAFITTEKDAVKITPELRAQLEATAPLLVATLRAAFLDEDNVVRELEARIS
jgi:tetraacyldisaccharide 4'-kinase